MELLATQTAWKAALETLSPIRASSQVLPILGCLLIEVTDQGVTLTRTDRERQLRVPLRVEQVDGTGELAVDARKLAGIVASLPPTAEILARQTEQRLTLAARVAGRVMARFTLSTLPGEDYPLMADPTPPAADDAAPAAPLAVTRLRLPGRRLAAALHYVSFAVAKNDVRYYLNGLLFEWSGTSLLLVGTDGHRLADIGLAVALDGDPGQAIVPLETLAILAKIGAASGAGEVVLELTANRLATAWPGGALYSKLIDGRFPDWRRVVPTHKAPQAHWRLPAGALGEALSRVRILASAEYQGCTLEVKAGEPETLYLRAANREGDEAEETLALATASAPGRWGFRVDYLLDALARCLSAEVEIKLGDTQAAAWLAPVGAAEDGEQENPEWVVMPMLL